MLVRVLLVLTLAASAYCTASQTATDAANRRNSRLLEEIRGHGYPAEVHQVTTEDGYVLSMHRIPRGRRFSLSLRRRPVVFLMHGLMSTSSHYLYLGPDYGMGYNLADAGYDVWMGNHRGNYFSRQHVRLDPNNHSHKVEFFDYSWEQVGLYDIPAMVEYALAFTGQEKLHYIGHSQGGTVFFVLGSMKPEFLDNFASVNLLAGVGYMDQFPFKPLRLVANLSTVLWALGKNSGFVEISIDLLPFSEQLKLEESGVDNYCVGVDEDYVAFCEMIGMNYLLDGINLKIPHMGGCSLKQIVHFGQNIKDGYFQRFDNGLLANRLEYGTFTPPAYDLSRITANVTMHYTVSDILLDESDVLAMAAVMPNAVVRRVAKDEFRHASFLFSRDVKELVTDYIIDQLDRLTK